LFGEVGVNPTLSCNGDSCSNRISPVPYRRDSRLPLAHAGNNSAFTLKVFLLAYAGA